VTAVLIPTASEAEWLEARRRGITASEIAIVMGLSPYGSPYALYHSKLGNLPDPEDTGALERGRVLEPYVAGKFAAAHPEFAVIGNGRELWTHHVRPWQMATPDRLLADGWPPGFEYGDAIEEFTPIAVLETKTDAGSDEWGEPGTDEIPVHYRCQVLWQMDVMGVDVAYVACLRVRDWKVREYIVQLDDDAQADLNLMRAEARDFLDRLDLGDEPDVDWRPATLDALKALHPSVEDTTAEIGPQLAAWYEAAVRNSRHWERRKKLYEAQMRKAAGSARRIVRKGPGQVPVARRDVYDVRESVRKPYTVDKFVATPPKEKK
jgi:putative phage-type endonuclease